MNKLQEKQCIALKNSLTTACAELSAIYSTITKEEQKMIIEATRQGDLLVPLLSLTKEEVEAILKQLNNEWINRENILLIEMLPKMQNFVYGS